MVQKDNSNLFGVVTGKFSYLVKDKGRAFGIKFKPGAFYPFVNVPISRFTDRAIDLVDVFGSAGVALESAILALEDAEMMIAVAECFVRERLPECDRNIAIINRIIDSIIADGTIIKVDDRVERLGLNK